MNAGYSLRRRLSLGLLAGLLAAGALVGGGLYLYLSHVLAAAFDRTLLEQGRLLAARVEQDVTADGPGPLDFEYAESGRSQYAAGAASRRRGYFELRDAGGGVLARSGSLRDGAIALAALPVPEPPPGADRYAFTNLELPGDVDGRAVTLRFRPDAEGRDVQGRTVTTPDAPAGVVTLVLATSRAPLDRTLSSVMLGLAGGGVVLACAGAAVIGGVMRRAMRPLDRWAAAITQLDPAAPDGGQPDATALRHAPLELRPVADKLGELLRRVADAMARERRFTDDAAHELRTPLAEIRAAAEVGLLRGTTDAATRRTLQDVAASAVQMTRLVDALLSLRRAGRRATGGECVDVVAVVRQAVARLSAGSHRCWTVRSPDALCRATDPTLLATAVENLLSNAAAHAAGDGKIDVALCGEAAGVVFVVSNPCDGISPEFAERGCEPFWRPDAARRDDGHFGLGLTLVAECCRRVGGGVSFEVADGRLHARLRWPAAEAAD